MAYTVEELEIKVTSSAESASTALDKLKDTLGELKTACDGVNTPLSTLQSTLSSITGMFQNFKSMTEPVKETTKALKALNAAGQDVKGLDNLSKSLAGLEHVQIGDTAFALNAASQAVKGLSSGGGKSRGSSETENLLDRLATKANVTRAKFTALSIAVMKLSGGIAKCVNSANEYIETINLFQVAMGKYYDEAFEYSQLVSEKLGIDPSQWMNAQGTFMAMAKGFGVTEKQAYDLSESLTELSYDISSLYNESVETSITRLQSALAGEIEPVRRLGVSISQATLQEYAMAHGIDETVSSMTEQEKALLRTLVLIESSSKIGAVGDFAKTLESPANALRVLQQQFVQLARAIGNVFIPVLVQIIPVVQAVVSVLSDLINFLAKLVGFKMPEWDSNSWSSGLVSGAEDAEKALTGAGTAAKKLKDYTMGIDELNVINPNSGSGGGAGGSSGISDWAKNLEIPDLWNKDEIAELETQMGKIKEKLELILPIAVAVGAAFALWKIGPELLAGLKLLKEAFDLLLGKSLVPTSGKVLELTKLLKFVGVAAVIGILIARFKELYDNNTQFRVGLRRLGEVFSGVFGAAKDILEGLWTVITDIGKAILNLIPEEARKAVEEFFESLSLDSKDLALVIAGVAALFVPGGALIGGLILGFEAVTLAIRALGKDSTLEWGQTKEKFSEIWGSIKTTAKECWDNIKDYVVAFATAIVTYAVPILKGIITILGSILENGIKVLTGIIEFITGVFNGDWVLAWEGLKQIGDGALNFIGDLTETIFGVNIVDVVKNWFKDHVEPWFHKEKWAELGENIKTAIKGKFDELWENVTKGFNSFKESVPGLISGIKTVMLNNFKKALNSIIESFENCINRVISGWNSLVNIGRAIPGVGESLSDFLTITPIQIPRLQTFANGGYPEHGQMFIARESGPELVGSIGRKTAVANNNQIIEGIADGVYSAVAAAMMDNGNSGGEVSASFNIYLSGKQIAAEVEQVNKRKGARIMTGGSY